MIISDLQHIETVEGAVEGGYFFGTPSKTLVLAKIREDLSINKQLTSKAIVVGNFAGAEAEAFSSGYDTTSQAISFTNTIAGKGSASKATSVSATSGYFWVY